MNKILLAVVVILAPAAFSVAQQTPRPDPPYQFEPPQPGQPGFPQQHGPGGMMRTNPEIRRQLEEIKIWQMTKEMNLPTDKSERFFPLYNRYTEEMRHTTSEREGSVRKLDSLIRDRANEADVRKQIEDVTQLDTRLADIHLNFIRSLGKILTPTEIAKYMVFEQRFDREIRMRIRMLMQQRMRGRGR